MQNEKDTYFVAVKVFLENEDGKVLITKDRFGDWDIPGGRLRTMDFNVPLHEVVERKVREELGVGVQYKIGEPVVHIRHERNEILKDGRREMRRIFAVGYAAKLLEGEIALGANHEELHWLSRDEDASQFLDGGWLQGINDYWHAR